MTFPQCVGSPCGQHGPYTFYKAFKYFKNGRYKTLALGEFFFVRISPTEDPCIGELHLLWDDRNSDQLLSSMRLYFLPEQTPEGRQSHHGEHEVLAASEKVILKLEDLVEWLTEEVEWTYGLLGICAEDVVTPPPSPSIPASDSTEEKPKFCANSVPVGQPAEDTRRQKLLLRDMNLITPAVMILSYPRYCRYRSVVKRLGEVAELWLKNVLVIALGGIVLTSRNKYILFCRDTFDNEALLQNDLNCEHLAPNLKGRPRKKCFKTKYSASNSSESNASDDNKELCGKAVEKEEKNIVRKVPCKDEQEFLQNLFRFMKDRNTPIHRVPHLGFKQIDLYFFYTYVQKLGGYEKITHKKLWKHVYDEMGGNPGSTSAATCTRRHYERLLLPFEQCTIYSAKYLPPVPRNKRNTEEANDTDKFNNRTNDQLVPEIVNEDNGKVNIRKIDGTTDNNCAEDSKETTNTVSSVKGVVFVEEKLPVLKVKLEKLQIVKQHGENSSQKHTSFHQTRVMSSNDILFNNEPKWNEIRQKNALARSWAHHFYSAKMSSKSQIIPPISNVTSTQKEESVPAEENKVCSSSADVISSTSNTSINSTVQSTLLDTSTTIPLSLSMVSNDKCTTTVFSSCVNRPITTTLDIHLNRNENTCSSSKSVISSISDENSGCSTSNNSPSAGKHFKNSSLEVSACVKNVISAEKHNSLYTSKSDYTLNDLVTGRQGNHKLEPWVAQTRHTVSLASCNVVYSTMTGKNAASSNPTLNSHFGSEKCKYSKQDIEGDEHQKQDILSEQGKISLRRPSVILHTEQMQPFLQSDLPPDTYIKNNNPVNALSLSRHITISDDRFLRLLELRPVKKETGGNKVGETTAQIKEMADKQTNKIINSSFQSNKAEGSNFSVGFHQNIPLSTKISGLKSDKIFHTENDTIKECKGNLSVTSHLQKKKQQFHISSNFYCNPIKEPYYEHIKRQKCYNTPVVFCSQTYSLSSKPVLKCHDAKTATHVPAFVNHSYENDEVLDLSTKNKPEEISRKSFQTTPLRVTTSTETECLDLSVKKPSDFSALPSGIENITPPPPPHTTGEDSCPGIHSLGTETLTPLGPTKFYSDLVLNTKNSSHMVSLLDSKLSATLPQDLPAINRMASTIKGTGKAMYVTDYNSQLSSFVDNPYTVTTHLWTTVFSPSYFSSTQPSNPSYKDLPNKVFPKCYSQSFPPRLYTYLYKDKSFYSSYTK